MKKAVFISVVSILLTQMAQAECPKTADLGMAKKLNLSGKVVIATGGKTESDRGARLSQKSEEFKAFAEMVDKSSVIISGVFGLEEQGEITAIIQNKNTCELSVFGTDGEDSANLKIEKLTRFSVSYIKENGQISEVRKLKKASAFKN